MPFLLALVKVALMRGQQLPFTWGMSYPERAFNNVSSPLELCQSYRESHRGDCHGRKPADAGRRVAEIHQEIRRGSWTVRTQAYIQGQELAQDQELAQERAWEVRPQNQGRAAA